MGLLFCKPFFWNKKVGDDEEDDDDDEFRKEKRYQRTPAWHDANLLKYSFVHRKVCDEYLKCDIKPLKRKRGSYGGGGKSISLERLPTDFFDRDRPGGRRLVRQHFILDGETYRRVVGYREIMMKREYADYLEELKITDGGITTSNKINKSFPVYQYWRLARGGGGKKPAAGGKHDKKGETGGKTHEKKAEKKDEEKKSKPEKHKETNKSDGGGGGCFGGLCKNNDTSTKKDPHHQKKASHGRKDSHDKSKNNAETFLKHQAVKKWKWPNHRKRMPTPNDPKYIVLLHHLYRMPKENEERDNEWLYLSSSTEDNDPNVLSHFEKEPHKWMTPGISYESQKLFHHFSLMWTLMLLSGRSFLHRRNNFYRGHIEFSCRKRQMIFYFLTSILFWTILCMAICSYSDINTHLNILHSRSRFFLVEKIEIRKYWLPYSLFITNLILVSFTSLAVILGDGALIAHYMNCWCAALHEMESSAALGIRKITLINLQLYLLVVGAYTVMFVCDWPGQVRGSCMLTSMLLLRSSIPLVRINQPNKVLMYQWIGFGIQVYVFFCARLVMCFLQIFAIMLRNICELWNFKLALRFHLIAKETRGELFEMSLNHSLGKLWSHHRLIVSLLEEYGLVFSVGIMCYIIPQLCVFAVALATFILSDESYVREEFYGRDTHILIYSDYLPIIKIPYYHSQLEESVMALCIFLHNCIDFFFTTEVLTSATTAFMAGAEFVRRAGMMSCEKSHERRLIFSLQWSFNPTRLRALTANRFFTLDRFSLTKLLTFFILVFTILIRMDRHRPLLKVKFPLPGSCSKELGQTLIHGICTVTGDPYVPPIPPPPPANYYFFMEHCEEIEKKYKDKVKAFEYYSDKSSSRIADQPPFQICRVKIQNGTKLPTELVDLGRYFQDHGNPRLKETLKIYLNQTLYPPGVNYSSVAAAVVGNHPISSGGTYCGPDLKGQYGQLCEWLEYYRDCVVACYSKAMSKVLLVQKMWKKVSTGHYILYTDYSKVDCGINPFGLKFKGGQWSVEEPAYDCFGQEVKLKAFDLCSNIPLKEPVGPFTPAIGDPKRLQRSYTSKWLAASKSVAAAPLSMKSCDNCYDAQVGHERCGDSSLVHDHCPYSRYWGEPGPARGYYIVEKCFELNIDALDTPKANGFCRWDYVEGGILAGHVVSQVDYDKARLTQWDKEWNVSKAKAKDGELAPCEQPEFFPGALPPIHEHLYFKHVCMNNIPQSGSCGPDPPPGPSTYFYAFRPYEIKDCTKLRQIKLDYEKFRGNSQVCSSSGTMKVPENVALNLTIRGKTETYWVFYGCSGKLLLPTNTGNTYHCISPKLGGVCEVDAEVGFFLYGDCTDPEVVASKSAVLYSRKAISQWKLDFGLCSALIDYADPLFKDYRLKLLSEELVQMLRSNMAWRTVDKWATSNNVLTKHPGVPALPNGKNYCDLQLTTNYCGENSVPLHYPYDGQDSVQKGDKFLCNWEVYYRDCMQPFNSTILGGWVYLPKWTSASTKKLHPKQRKVDPLLNVFWGDKDAQGCDGRKLLTSGKSVDNYWKDECGWIMTPEFLDGDVKSLAVMAPILPFSYKAYDVMDDGQSFVDKVVHCHESEYAIYRCTHPDIAPICKSNLSIWEPAHDVVDVCYRFNTSCYEVFNKQPNGSVNAPTYPEGFCRGYCPMVDTKKEGALNESLISVWRNLTNMGFTLPPCSNSTPESLKLFPNFTNHREIELRLFSEFHCSDLTMNGVLRDHTGPSSSSFNWPMYRDTNFTFEYKFIPLEVVLGHLKSNFGASCNYGGSVNHDIIYPKVASWRDAATGEMIHVNRSEFLGCNGYPLIMLADEIKQNPEEMDYAGIKNPLVDYPLICYGRLLAGWCEARVEPLVFMRDDFEITCDGSKGSPPATCPHVCTDMQGHFAKHPLASRVEDIPGYWPFVQSKTKYVLLKGNDTISSHRSTRIDLPYRRLLLSEFKEATIHWRMFKEAKFHRRYTTAVRKDKWKVCFRSGNFTYAMGICHFPLWLKRCVVPCTLVTPKIITQVAQSLVDVTPGQGDMFLMNIPYGTYKRGILGSSYEPKYSFMDCVIDPMTVIRNHSSPQLNLQDCFGNTIYGDQPDGIDEWKWVNYPEFLPDYNNQVTDPVTGFVYIPWKLDYLKKTRFNYEIYDRYDDPSIVYAPKRSTVQKTALLFASPYLACHRMTQEPMRTAVLTALGTYWNKSIEKQLSTYVMFPNNAYSYDPEQSTPNLCKETAVAIYLDGKACTEWNVPSPVLRIYGACKAIFPAINAHNSYAALREKVQGTPPEGCISNTSNYAIFNKTWGSSKGYFGFGILYSMQDVYDMWNSLCHSCAYTREMHHDNLRKTWCGYEVNNRSTCLSDVESANRKLGKKHHFNAMVHGEGIFFRHWTHGYSVARSGFVYRLGVHYFCWNSKEKRYMAFARWRAYHPWSQFHEKAKPAAYLIHVPLNALNCLYPCKGPDESEDCNSLCPLEAQNPCEKHPEEFFSFQSPTVGINYTLVLKEQGRLCNARMAGLGETTQGLGIFGEYGFNNVRADKYFHHRGGLRIFNSSSELVFQNDPSKRGVIDKYYHNFYNYQLYWGGSSFLILRKEVTYNNPSNGSFELPRMAAVHPGWHEPGAESKPQFSSFCAGFEGDKCEVLEVDWDRYHQKPPKGYTTFATGIQRVWDIKPIDYLKINFSSGCTARDRKLVTDLLGSDPRGTYDKTYCCIPHQMNRMHPQITSTEWEMRYFLVARNTWTQCEDIKNPKTHWSYFGWQFGFNKFARYLSGCPFQDCRSNSCKHQLRAYKPGSDTDLCTRQFDPEETFLKKPLPNCKLPKPPF